MAGLVPRVSGSIFMDRVHENRTGQDRKSTRLNSSHLVISYAVFCLKKTIHSTTRPYASIASPAPYFNSTRHLPPLPLSPSPTPCPTVQSRLSSLSSPTPSHSTSTRH